MSYPQAWFGNCTALLHKSGHRHNDPLSRYIEMGMPKVLDAAQPGNVQRATADVPEQDRIVMTDASGSASATVPMQSNDVALWPATY
jgi:xylan 1,4-beta-xylosidase